ncbi:hypothetical protein P5V15_012809 [Pogonomyrmex californicus]
MLGRSVPVFLDCETKNCIDLFLRYRKANISKKNPYIFALPDYDKKHFKYIKACDLLRHYSLECESKLSLRLRNTKLHKHAAIRCVTLNFSDHDVTEFASCLDHDKSIHLYHYRQSSPQIEIVKMSQLLKIAQNEDQNIEQDVADDNLQVNVSTVMFSNNYDNGNNTDDSNTTYGAVENMYGKKKDIVVTSPYGMTKHITWTEEEYNIITASLQHEIKDRHSFG